MKQAFFLFLWTAVLAACQPGTSNQGGAAGDQAQSAAPAENLLTDTEKTEGWKLLFDGTSLDQWRGYNRPDLPKLGWVAKDGQMVIEKTPDPRPADFGGDLITKEEFGNFELSLDFLLTPHANSGILYLAIEEKDSAIWHNAPEYQLIDNEGWAKADPGFNMATHRTGDNYDMQASAADYMKPVGEWNTARIVHKDGHVEHWLNGKKCLEYQTGSPEWETQLARSKFKVYPNYGRAKQGHVGLQDHDHEVRFKNIKIRSL